MVGRGWIVGWSLLLACETSPQPGASPSRCEGARPITQVDESGAEQPTGWFRCDGGVIHRGTPLDCMPSDSVAGSCSVEADGNECSVDADCTAQPYGRCDAVSGFMSTGCTCVYGCERDADCGDGRACYCAGMTSRCVTAFCRSQADCGEGYLCAMLDDDVLACHSPDDTCRTDRDCPDGTCPACEYDPAKTAWECVPDGGRCDTGGG